MFYDINVITKRLGELKFLERNIDENTDEVTHNFIETAELAENIQEQLSQKDEFLSQKITMLNINEKLNTQLENQVSPDFSWN